MSQIEQRIRAAQAAPLSNDTTLDPMDQLRQVLASVGLAPEGSGGEIRFVGADPVISSPWPLATMAAVSLMAKAVAVADLWRLRTGQGQDLSVNLGQVLHRLCPFYDKKWELLNGYAPGAPSDPANPFMPSHMYQTRDGRWIQLLNIYPRTKTAMLGFLGCNDDPRAIAEAVRRWDAFALEEAVNRAGLQATVVRTVEEFLQTEQFQYLKTLPLVEVLKIGDSEPVAFTPDAKTPLDGVRAIGLGHVIAGSGLGRALAYHGADVLNLWRPNDFEMDLVYYSANVGMRSATLDFAQPAERARLDAMIAHADVFFANRRPGYLEKFDLTAEQMAQAHPGLIHVDMSLYGWDGPWAGRTGFDQNAGGVSGVLALEGSPQRPRLTEIFVVNDYAMSWIASVAVAAALKRRALEGGSYRIRICLARLSLWLLEMGVFDKAYAKAVAGQPGGHEYLPPDLFQADTPCGHYQGVTDQVTMSATPGHYAVPLVPRGASRLEWPARSA
ncbi:CoA transferase [Caulobacter sp. SSI4214]|uniref:CoA transferase n=1 Tax=Caulobacter sp. SSI4214 TaxID=2575739 RepID=UPI00143BDA21|nr:CoA transferase [Caulobacter sp. SSI4214]